MLKKEHINREWNEFNAKIVYIYEKLFENDKEKLLLYFTDHSLGKKQKNRKKTIENWLEGRTKKPNGFHLSKFKISEYRLNGKALLEINAFKKWSLKTFKERVDLYLKETHSADVPNEIRFIYFFNTVEKKLGYFEISYPNEENHSIVHLYSPLYASNMTYRGTLTTFNNMTYISVQNQFDYMHYIFKNNVNVFKKELKVFGVAQCVDAPTREPKSYLALLTSNRLTPTEERNFAHKLNFSNLMIADDFTDGCNQEKTFFLENFSEKIHALSRDIEHYNIHEVISQDMYLDIILKEYRSYITLLEKAFYHSDYIIDHRRQSILFALEEMCQHEMAEATILYQLDSENLTILDYKNSIMEMQLKLVKAKKLKLNYLFIVSNISLLTKRSIRQIQSLEQHGIDVKLTSINESIYSKILVVKDKDFAIYKRKNDHSENHVTKNALTIEELNFEVEELSKIAISLNEFIAQNYHLNGTWYHYTFSSRQENLSYQTVKFNITNSSVLATFPTHTNKGELLTTKEYTLILMENSVIKIQNIVLKNKIFRVSIIGKELNMYNRDILLFGLMSRKELKEEQLMPLLQSIHKQEDEKYWLKISDNFDSTLAYFEM